MIIREYKSSDCIEMAKLFYDTVHTINVRDYSKRQINVWATGNVDEQKWDKSFSENITIIAEENDIIVGFGDMDKTGYLDRLYVCHDRQREGIATAIVNELERQAALLGITRTTTFSSITAKPFFIKCGFHLVRENLVLRDGVELINYLMEKEIK